MKQSLWLGRTITPELITPTATSRCRPNSSSWLARVDFKLLKPIKLSYHSQYKLEIVTNDFHIEILSKSIKSVLDWIRSTILRNMINRVAGPDRPWCLVIKWFSDFHDSSVFKLLSECHCCITEELLRTSIRISLVRCQPDVETIALIPFTPYAMCRYGEHDFIFFGSHSIAKFAAFGPCALLFAHQKLLVYRG